MIPNQFSAETWRRIATTARDTGSVDELPHLFGPVTCMTCGHYSIAAAWPAESDGKLLQCVKCKTMSGRGRALIGG